MRTKTTPRVLRNYRGRIDTRFPVSPERQLIYRDLPDGTRSFSWRSLGQHVTPIELMNDFNLCQLKTALETFGYKWSRVWYVIDQIQARRQFGLTDRRLHHPEGSHAR